MFIPTFLLVAFLSLFAQATPFGQLSSAGNARSPLLKQATRSQVIKRMTRPRQLQRRASPVPFPPSTCTDYTSTGTVPYAVFTGLDYNSASGYTKLTGVATREACIKMCESDSACIVTTYTSNQGTCYIVRVAGSYFKNGLDAATRGKTCAQESAATSGFSGVTCCTQYRAA